MKGTFWFKKNHSTILACKFSKIGKLIFIVFLAENIYDRGIFIHFGEIVSLIANRDHCIIYNKLLFFLLKTEAQVNHFRVHHFKLRPIALF